MLGVQSAHLPVHLYTIVAFSMCYTDLFMFAGKIHGLCFQEEQQSQEIGELLTK